MGQRSTFSLLDLRDGSFFSGCESSEDVFQVECACLCFSLSLFLLFLSLSLLGCLESKYHLKVKEKHK